MSTKRAMKVVSLAAGGGGIKDVRVVLSPDTANGHQGTSHGIVLYELHMIYRDCELPDIGDRFTVTVSDAP